MGAIKFKPEEIYALQKVLSLLFIFHILTHLFIISFFSLSLLIFLLLIFFYYFKAGKPEETKSVTISVPLHHMAVPKDDKLHTVTGHQNECEC